MKIYSTLKHACLLSFLVGVNSLFALSAPTGLMCELLDNPTATTISDATPEFGWIMNSDIVADEQSAYQIMVATSAALLEQDTPDKWDSGKSVGDASVNVAYQGSALAINSTYYWKIRLWDKADQVSAWSDIQQIKTGTSLSGYNTARYKQVGSQIAPVSVTPLANGHYLVDFGKDAFGYIQWQIPEQTIRIGTAEETMIKLSQVQPEVSAGTSVEFHFGEKLKNGLVDRAPGGTIRYYLKTVTLDGSGQYEIHPAGTTTGIAIPSEFGRIAPFRYVEIVNCPYTVATGDVRQISVHYPFNDNASSFSCNDQVLNDVWELCKYSIKPTSFCGVYVDGDRERKPYEADAYINQLCHYCVDREYSLARYSHEYLLANPTWPTEWKQHSIMMAWMDYMYTGNSESLAACYNTLKSSKLLQQYARTDGLLNTGSLQDIVDWPAGERDGFVFKPVNTVVNAFYYHTLLLMQQIATVLGNTADAQKFASDAALVYQSFQSILFNSQTGLYLDGESAAHSSLHANMFALAFGLVPADKQAVVADFVKSKGMACSVYGAQYLLEALYYAGEEQTALALMTSDSSRSWVNMMREGSTITMEAWGIAYKPNQDWNHAWGAAPANIIPRFIAGVRPLEAGFAKILIQPQPATLTQFQATVPSIRGAISVGMVKQADNCVFQLTIPANIKVRFVIPANCSEYDEIILDGEP
ncbi:MAG: hypothetical protein JW745_00095, partial [Sedimentisphaerales bacterium]|nr:hypothetical protein [Sedimentisphaerales bacterium]